MTVEKIFNFSSIFATASRQQCIRNLKKVRTPNYWKSASTQKAHKAALLIPVCQVDDVPSILYTVRSPYLSTHSGQISFPGGNMVPGEPPEHAALRETHEEIGLPPDKVDVWGQGNAIPGRNSVTITPIIGSVINIQSNDLSINRKEVSEVFAVPMELLCDPKNQYHTQFKNGLIMPVFVVEDYKIWGITAYLTHIFLNSLLPKEIYKNEWMKQKIDLNADRKILLT